MGEDLFPIRAKVTVEAAAYLKAESLATDRDISEIVREILHAHALKQIRKATLLQRLLKHPGQIGADGGTPGSDSDADSS